MTSGEVLLLERNDDGPAEVGIGPPPPQLPVASATDFGWTALSTTRLGRENLPPQKPDFNHSNVCIPSVRPFKERLSWRCSVKRLRKTNVSLGFRPSKQWLFESYRVIYAGPVSATGKRRKAKKNSCEGVEPAERASYGAAEKALRGPNRGWPQWTTESEQNRLPRGPGLLRVKRGRRSVLCPDSPNTLCSFKT